MKKSKKKISAKEFDEAFDRGEDVTKYLDLRTAKVVYPIKRINVDIPTHVIGLLDREAAKIGVTRTSLIKMWIAERLGLGKG